VATELEVAGLLRLVDAQRDSASDLDIASREMATSGGITVSVPQKAGDDVRFADRVRATIEA